MAPTKSGRSRSRKKLSSAVKVPPVVDFTLTALYWAEVAFVLFMLRNDVTSMRDFLLTFVTVSILIRVARYMMEGVGHYMSRTALAHPPFNNPLGKAKPRRKFSEQGWQLFQHIFFSLWEIHILSRESWWNDTKTCWIPHPREQEHSYELRLLYLAQLGVYIYTGLSCRYLEDRKKDYVVMMSHHIITILLIAGSYYNGYLRIGLLVLVVHDVSDVPIDALKLVNLVKLEGLRGLFLTETFFIATLTGWLSLRLYAYPTRIIRSAMFDYHCLHADKDKCEIFKNWSPEGMPFWNLACLLLLFLLVLHIWWFYLMIRMLVGLLTKGAHKTGQDEYEGRSSDSEGETSAKDE